MRSIQSSAQERYYFIKKRAIEIAKCIKKITKWDRYHDTIDAKISEVSKNFPQANLHTINNIVKIDQRKMVRQPGEHPK